MKDKTDQTPDLRGLEFQVDELSDKVSFQAERFQFDLSDDVFIDRLIGIAVNPADEDLVEKAIASASLWTEYMFAIAYCQMALASTSEDVNEKIAALCLGNWAIGIVGGLNKNDLSPTLCVECVIKAYHSENGKSGAKKKHAPMNDLQEWTLSQYRLGKWPSANKAAHALKDRVIEYGRTIKAYLTEENAQRTIADWIRNANNKEAINGEERNKDANDK